MNRYIVEISQHEDGTGEKISEKKVAFISEDMESARVLATHMLEIDHPFLHEKIQDLYENQD